MSRVKLFICSALIMLLPLQSLAAAYQLACLMQQQMDNGNPSASCHEHMAPAHLLAEHAQMSGTEMADMPMHDTMPIAQSALHDTESQPAPEQSSHTQSSKCILVCAQANMAALPNSVDSQALEFAFNHYPPLQMHYASVTLPSLQRPPIIL